MYKMLNTFHIAILSVVALFLISLLIYAVTSGDNFYFLNNFDIKKTADNIRKDETFNLSDIQNLNLDFVSSDIKITITDDEDLRIIQYSNQDLSKSDLFTSKEISTTLEIRDRKNSFSFFDFGMHRSIFEVYIPKRYANNLNVNASSADLVISDEVQFKNLILDFISGDIDINNKLTADDLKLKTISGDIDITSIVGLDATIETTSGDISINNIILNSDIKSISGDIEIGNLIGRVNVQTISGSINMDTYSITSNSSAKTVSGDVTINLNKDSNCEIRTDTISGHVSLPNKSHVLGNPPYNILDIKTTSGDIKIALN